MSSKTEADRPYPPDELAQLPHGRHGLPPEFVEHNQRERLIASFIALAGEVGFTGSTITTISEGAGVSTRSFYKYFDSVEETCVAAYEKAVADLRPLVRDAYLGQRGEPWPLRVRAALAVVLAEFTELPDVGRLLTVEPFVAGPRIAAMHKAVLEEMVPFLREGREFNPAAEWLPPTTERGLLGAVNSMVGRHVVAGEREDLVSLLPDLTQFLLTPYLGAEEAQRLAG